MVPRAIVTVAQALQSSDVREALHTVHAAQDVAKAALLADPEASRVFELDGASTPRP